MDPALCVGDRTPVDDTAICLVGACCVPTDPSIGYFDDHPFVSLNGGHIVFGFGEITIEPGDEIRVYEVGSLLCPDGGFVDESFRISLGHVQEGPFIVLGDALGTAGIAVDPALPVCGNGNCDVGEEMFCPAECP